jgi:glycosyltransferase involved in cell wall biosynthesis
MRGGVAGGGRSPSIDVCMVIQGFAPAIGGAELQLQRLLPHLAARGVTVSVLTRGHAGAPSRESVRGAQVIRTRVSGASALAAAVYVLSALAYLLRHRGRIDLVHAHGSLSEGAIALAAAALRLPALVKVLRAGVQGDFDQLGKRPLGKLRARLLARSVFFVSLSEEVRQELRERGVSPDRIFAVPNGVDVEAFRPAAEPERAALARSLGLGDGMTAVYVGRLIDVKQVDTLVRALAQLSGVQLVVVGEGPELPNLRALAESTGVSGRVRFEGARGNVADYLRAADVFVLPSQSEGLSNALLEAMACGLACVATPVSGSADLLADGRGILVPPGDVAGWQSALGRLAADPRARRELGARASEYVRATHSIEVAADGLVAAYREMLRQRRS